MAQPELTIKLRLLAADEGTAGKLARLIAGVTGVRKEFDALGGAARASAGKMREGIDSISRQLARIQAAAITIAGAFHGAGFVGGIARACSQSCGDGA